MVRIYDGELKLSNRKEVKFLKFRPQVQSDILNATLDVTLNGTEKAVYAVLKQKPDSSREEIAEMILCVKLLKNESFTHIMC